MLAFESQARVQIFGCAAAINAATAAANYLRCRLSIEKKDLPHCFQLLRVARGRNHAVGNWPNGRGPESDVGRVSGWCDNDGMETN